MSTSLEQKSKLIAGISIKTNNLDAMKTIPALWGRFFAEGVAGDISSKLTDDIFAVYTGFENEGKNNEGDYTFLIGVEVGSSNELPDGVQVTVIPAGRYREFEVPGNSAERVFETWQTIWQQKDIGKTFKCDYEYYSDAGSIAINVGTNH